MTVLIPEREVKDIECWGHRGASAHLPENTLASFQAAIEEGADGIESDIHATSDGVILMFHDPSLNRTTNGTGLIREQPWKGIIEHVRTTKEPVQQIPRFEELVDLLMVPANHHVILNIDCKMQNDPEKVFPEMARILATHPNWEIDLAPRIILGLWHPIFLPSAYRHLPQVKRYHIGFSIPIVRQFFWDYCEGFSLAFPLLMASEGQAFLKECRERGKEICVWTVNNPDEMKVAMSWGVKAILTDRVAAYTQLKNEVVADPSKLNLGGIWGSIFGWTDWKYYTAAHVGFQIIGKTFLKTHGGPLLPYIPENDPIASNSTSKNTATSPTTTTTTTIKHDRPRRRSSLAEFADNITINPSTASMAMKITNPELLYEMAVDENHPPERTST